ncbi:peptidoglycan-binding domain-containing protein [Agromyces albus]|uniref:peptidoglycan-binding domain-containing protein n=1 Tax=Agromyces albus TaxID=205332 RepID=UPI002786A376|nr:peptidoglycan-binding protein [Agromyces albus]MDQ0576661.1 zinc D-Ala-D-Ala carboxypeptidase [Agromyces albus]
MTLRTRRHKFALALAAVSLVATGAVSSAGTAAPAEASTRCVDNVYGYGGYSTCIGYIQKLLNFQRIGLSSTYHNPAGPYPTLAVDNSFGSATLKAVLASQRYWGLKDDGYVGPKTWNIICSPQQGPGPVAGFPYAAARAAGCDI